jgi:hypothetical protein
LLNEKQQEKGDANASRQSSQVQKSMTRMTGNDTKSSPEIIAQHGMGGVV